MLDSLEFKKYAIKHHGISEETLNKYAQNAHNMTRSVIEERRQPFREIDVFSRLIMDRIVFLGSAIDDHVSNVIVAQLLFLDSLDAEKDILLYINSPGGQIYAGLAIYDTIQYIKAPVGTMCIGLAASMASILLAGGQKGKRASLPHSRIMIHQPLGGAQGQMTDMEITVNQIKSLADDLYKILADHSGQSLETIRKDANRDYWMRAEESKQYGLIDQVLKPSKQL